MLLTELHKFSALEVLVSIPDKSATQGTTPRVESHLKHLLSLLLVMSETRRQDNILFEEVSK